MRASASTTHIDPTIHPIHVDCLDCGPTQFPRTCLRKRVIALRVCAERAELSYSCPFHMLIWSMSMQ